MSKQSREIDPRQHTIDFTWTRRVETHLADKMEILVAAGEASAAPDGARGRRASPHLDAPRLDALNFVF